VRITEILTNCSLAGHWVYILSAAMASLGERSYLDRQLQELEEEHAKVKAGFLELYQKLSAADEEFSSWVPSLCRGSDTAEEKPVLRNGVLRSRYPASNLVVIADNNDMRPLRRTMRRRYNSRHSGESPYGSYYGEPRSAPPFNPPRVSQFDPPYVSPATVPSRPTVPPSRPSLVPQPPPPQRPHDPGRFSGWLQFRDDKETHSAVTVTQDAGHTKGMPVYLYRSTSSRESPHEMRRRREREMRELVWVMHILRHQPELLLDAAKVQLSTQTPIKDAIDWALLLDHAADQKPAVDSDLQGNGSRFLSESRVTRSIAACSIGISSNSYHVEQLKTRAPDISNNVEIASPTLPEAPLTTGSAKGTSTLYGPTNQPRLIPYRERGKRLPADDPNPTNLLSNTTGFLPSSLIKDLTIFKPSVRDKNATLRGLYKVI